MRILTNESERIFKTVRVRKLTSMTELLENQIIHQVGLFYPSFHTSTVTSLPAIIVGQLLLLKPGLKGTN